jgi:hypothetical protein
MGGHLRAAGNFCEAEVSTLDRYAHAFRTGDKATQYRAWQEMADKFDSLERIVGRVGIFYDSVNPDPNSPLHGSSPITPGPAAFTVTGIDGKFIIQIANPQNIQPQSVGIMQARQFSQLNPYAAPILHNLQSASDINFNNGSAQFTDYGISSQLGYTFQNPNVVLFWRLRSSFDGKTWNQWQIYSSALTCGPVGVQSGLLRTAALTPVNSANTPTTQPLTAATGVGVNQATINVASFVVQYPPPIGQKTYNSGSVTPLLDSTKYYVYCLDPTYSGGAQTYFATVNNPDVSANDALIFLGVITTPAHGGGGTGGSGGGGGPCFTRNTLVITKSGIKRITDIIAGYDEVLTQRGWRKVRTVLQHDYDGPVFDMGADEYVTPDHRLWFERSWQRAAIVFSPFLIEKFYGVVCNLEIDGDGSDDEQCYTLANGQIAHNVQK